MPTPSPDLPQWLVYGAGAFGVFVAVLVTRLGFLKGASGQALPEKPQAAVGAVVIDMEALHKLTAAIEGHSMALLEGKKAMLTAGENTGEKLDQFGEEVRNLARDVRDLAREVSRKG